MKLLTARNEPAFAVLLRNKAIGFGMNGSKIRSIFVGGRSAASKSKRRIDRSMESGACTYQADTIFESQYWPGNFQICQMVLTDTNQMNPFPATDAVRISVESSWQAAVVRS